MPRAKKTSVTEETTKELTPEMKEQLAALVPTEPEVNETFIKLQDNLDNALKQAEAELQRIDERAEFAIQVVSQAIRTRAAVEKGKLLLEIKYKYHSVPSFEGTFTTWLKLAGISENQSQRWMNAARVVDDTSFIFGEEMLMNMSPVTLDKIHKLPVESKLDVLEKVETTGQPATTKEVTELSQQPEVKLSKAQELLAAARAKRDEARAEADEVKADPAISYTDSEYNTVMVKASKAEARIQELELQVEEFRLMARQSKAQAEAEAKARATAEAELDSLKFDDAVVREQRVKRIQATLTVQIPQVMGDIQKYLAEKKYYGEEYQSALDTLIKDLNSYLKEHA